MTSDAAAAAPVGEKIELGMLTGKEALRIRALLAREGKCVCEKCKRIVSLRDCIVVWHKGQVLSSACPECQATHSLLITREGDRIRLRVVPADRTSQGGQLIEVAPANAIDVLDKIGPKVEKREL
jgi:hypothetical protein